MNDSIIKTIAVAFSVCLVCSLVVSSSAVSLRDLQKENKLNDRRLKVLQVANIYDPSISISEQFSQLESKYIDFESGRIFNEYQNFNMDEIPTGDFDAKSIAEHDKASSPHAASNYATS